MVKSGILECMKQIVAVIVNYKTPLLACRSVISILQDPADAHVYVVDNKSEDGSLEILSRFVNDERIESKVTIVSAPKNGGFAYGCNLGVKSALADSRVPGFFLFLNPDAQIREGTCKTFSSGFADFPTVGIFGASVVNEAEVMQTTAHSFPSPTTEMLEGVRLGIFDRFFKVDHSRRANLTPPGICDWVSGACFAVRTEVLQRLNFLDEGYFLYFEEVDLCFRAKKDGWKVALASGAVALHLEGASTGITQNKRRPSYWFDSRRRFFLKNYGIGSLVLADVLFCLGRLTWRLRKKLSLGRNFSQSDPPFFLRDLLSGDLRYFWVNRRDH
jgi:N-acetylglucosaminyl-diphospho-decaprenol L-rhamnosyltransferase